MATCAINKIDSNTVGLRIAEEECLKLLPVAPVWNPFEPNSFSDFGTQTTLVARNPINPSRQRKKGVVTDIEASAGFNSDLTFLNMQNILQGFMYADTRIKASYTATGASGDLKISAPAGSFPSLTSTVLDFTTLGLIPGEYIFIGGDTPTNAFVNDENNGFKRVRSVTAHAIVFDKSFNPMATEAGAGLTIALYFAKVLKNETGPLIKRRSYQLERTLGSLDGQNPPQSEYVIGAVPNELTMTFASADKVTADLTFLACGGETRTQGQGLKTGTRPSIVEADAFDTSTDLQRVRLMEVALDDEAPSPLFGFVLESTLTLGNNASGNKALGVRGNFDVTAGTFEVGGSITAYFTDVAAVAAVQNNADVTLDYTFVKDNKGIIIDIPLMALGDGRPNVELDQPIMLPLTPMAASGAKVVSTMDHTLLWCFFDSLPDLAQLLDEA